ncbi:MAG TPA: hypothetical protein VMQ86_12080 [Bryobacteraceae bacterium]|jgi:hypothetical protein|nr:hypothetical protein [Bryobacteraceae bacterium]
MRTGPSFLAVFLLSAGLRAQDSGGPRAPAGGSPSLSEDQIRGLFRQAADADLKNDKKQRDYTYTQREVMRTLDGKGRVKSTESKTYEVMELYGSEVRRLVAKDDKALSGEAARKEEDRIQKVVARRTNEDEKEREKRQERDDKRREEDRQFVREVADAYDFHLTGIESLDGRETYVIDAEPRPGYQPRLKDARILPKFRFRAWIDKSEAEWKKLDVQCIDTISFGLVVARLHKGSRLIFEQTRVNDEVWLPQHMAVKLDARVALLKEFNIEQETTYRDYKKFRADTKVVPVGEVPEQH